MTDEKRQEYALMRYGIIAPAATMPFRMESHFSVTGRKPRERNISILTAGSDDLPPRPFSAGIIST